MVSLLVWWSLTAGAHTCESEENPSARAAPREPGAVARTVDVVTLNTWGLPAPLAPDRKVRLPRIDRALREADFDIVGLQEVWRGARRLFRREGLHLPETTGDSGLALLSRHPLRDVRAFRFRDGSGFDAFKRKGFLRAELDLGAPIQVLVTHLQSGRGRRAVEVRGRQVDELVAHLRTIDEPVVLMGDFNLYEDLDGRSLAALAEVGLVDAIEELDAERPTYPDGTRLDRVYVRCSGAWCLHPQAALSLVDLEPLSDHHPVHVQLTAHAR